MDTDIYKGLLRPPTILGIPAPAMIIEATIGGLLIVYQQPAYLIYLPFTHALIWFLTLRDPYYIEVLLKSLTTTTPIRNKRFWKKQSYAP